MSYKVNTDYSILDQPRVLAHIFHPRPEDGFRHLTDKDLWIPVEDDVHIGACFHVAGRSNPTILFFHGNGEIVADYDDLGEAYNRMGINFLVVDYRGYGRSTGVPSVSAMMKDCHAILAFFKKHLKANGFTGSLTLMGRSLGSASALELACQPFPGFDNLIIESGFAHAGKLLSVLGMDPDAIGFKEELGFGNAEKIKVWTGPTLIIHAQFDHIIPFSDGQDLFDACPASNKTLLKIPGANHNDIFMRGLQAYMAAVKKLVL
ncbi:alpha/beta hydrolase [Desulfocicer niacini]